MHVLFCNVFLYHVINSNQTISHMWNDSLNTLYATLPVVRSKSHEQWHHTVSHHGVVKTNVFFRIGNNLNIATADDSRDDLDVLGVLASRMREQTAQNSV